MKQTVSKAPKVALCRLCHGSGVIAENVTNGKMLGLLKKFNTTPPKTKTCPQCGGSGRVVVSATIEYEINPYTPD